MKLGIFEAGLPNAEHDAGSTAIIDLCTLLQSMGHQVEYFYTGQNPWGRTDDLAAHHIPFHFIPADFSQGLKKHAIDTAIISRPGPAALWLAACEAEKIPVIYFGHDIHHVRLARGNDYLPISTHDLRAMTLLEHHIWKHSHVVLYPSKEECDAVNAFCNRDHALELPIYDMEATHAAYKKSTATLPHPSAAKLLFVGGAHHAPNTDAMLWFTQDIAPRITADFSLSIVGDWPLALRQKIAAKFTGRISSDELYCTYHEAAVVIAPLRYGAGVKRKVVEALALGRPVLSTPIGFEGIDLQPECSDLFLSQIDAAAYAEKLSQLLKQQPAPGLSNHILKKYSRQHRQQVLEKAFLLL